ncbi:hypothetical protein OEZ85_013136 [Tetradesmus obliquus]|uniref:Uncharacterized protein n=1 Tax=Tetradesmus obliquus TaxID=3088 RepID=A0ABY8U4R7_TETOB|nr:hypothetical protein OEZ85_013136 [Tetradesmus obliquus]
MSSPLFTRTLLGYYEGIRELLPAAQQQQQDEAGTMLYRVTLLDEAGSCNPSFIGSLLRGANLGHGPASTVVTQEVDVPSLSHDRSSIEPGLVRVLMRTRIANNQRARRGPAAVLPCGWATCYDELSSSFRMGEQMQEWLWDYCAVTSDRGWYWFQRGSEADC